MDRVYVIGHQKPDTDSICSSISLAYLKSQLGYDARVYRLGNINRETKYVLNHFNVGAPTLLEDVKLQIKDLNYYRDYYLNYHTSIIDTCNFMKEKEITGIGIVDDNTKLIGLITNQRIIDYRLNESIYDIETSYDNLLKVLEGQEVLRINDEITGTINKDIFIAKSNSLISKLLRSSIKLLVVLGNIPIVEEYLELAKNNHINIIRTNYDAVKTAKTIGLANYIKTALITETISTFNEEDYYDDFKIKTAKLKHNNYPVIGKNGKCLGLIRITDINDVKNRKKVILVDHNESAQSVEGLEEAEILEVVDHHKIGDISTNNPINFRNSSVGACSTIIYQMYKENNIGIPTNIAGLLLSGILSDTLILTSPTTTETDKKVVEELSAMINIDYQVYGLDMFKNGTSLIGKSVENIVNDDLKEFASDNIRYAVSQVFTLDIDNIINKKNEYIEYINKLSTDRNYGLVLLLITDVVKQGSYLLYSTNSSEIIKDAFNIDNLDEGYYLENIVSRKKQVIPKLNDVIR